MKSVRTFLDEAGFPVEIDKRRKLVEIAIEHHPRCPIKGTIAITARLEFKKIKDFHLRTSWRWLDEFTLFVSKRYDHAAFVSYFEDLGLSPTSTLSIPRNHATNRSFSKRSSPLIDRPGSSSSGSTFLAFPALSLDGKTPHTQD